MSNSTFEYKFIYMPSHPKASSNGCVYEHVYVAEQKIGRYLNKDEVVHHIDGNKKNNNPDNLMIFASNSDHMAFHAGCDIYKLNEIWYAFKRIRKDSQVQYAHVCILCNKEFLSSSKIQKFCSHECSNNFKRILPDIKKLKEKIIEHNGNFSEVARLYNVSSNAIQRYLKRNNEPYHSEDYRQTILKGL